MPTIVHFDISADHPERAKRFYESLFGWKIAPLEGIPNYLEIETTDLKGDRAISGGITQRDPHEQNPIIHFIGVSSIVETLEKLDQMGGKLVRAPETIPGYGFVALCADSEDNIFGVFQDDKNAGLIK